MVRTIAVGPDSVILGRNGTALVSSKSEPGSWHVVKDDTCGCRGFMARGKCRHVAAVAQLVAQPAPVEVSIFDLYAQTLSGRFVG